MIELNFDLEFPEDEKVNGLALKMKTKERRVFDVEGEVEQLKRLVKSPPGKNEVYKMMSLGGGFSSISVIKFVGEFRRIDEMFVSTFRIGKKQFLELLDMADRDMLGNCHFVTSGTQEKTDAVAEYNGERYNYYEFIKEQCKRARLGSGDGRQPQQVDFNEDA